MVLLFEVLVLVVMVLEVVDVTWLMRERSPIPGGGDRGGEPNPLPVKRPEAENRDIALKERNVSCRTPTRSGAF